VVNYLLLIAEGSASIARLGARSLDEVVGRVELLEQIPGGKLDLSFVVAPTDASLPRKREWARNGEGANGVPDSGVIDNSRRTVGAALAPGDRRHYRGSAGQSFGAFLADGVELTRR
jgi:hypothetical protein